MFAQARGSVPSARFLDLLKDQQFWLLSLAWLFPLSVLFCGPTVHGFQLVYRVAPDLHSPLTPVLRWDLLSCLKDRNEHTKIELTWSQSQYRQQLLEYHTGVTPAEVLPIELQTGYLDLPISFLGVDGASAGAVGTGGHNVIFNNSDNNNDYYYYYAYSSIASSTILGCNGYKADGTPWSLYECQRLYDSLCTKRGILPFGLDGSIILTDATSRANLYLGLSSSSSPASFPLQHAAAAAVHPWWSTIDVMTFEERRVIAHGALPSENDLARVLRSYRTAHERWHAVSAIPLDSTTLCVVPARPRKNVVGLTTLTMKPATTTTAATRTVHRGEGERHGQFDDYCQICLSTVNTSSVVRLAADRMPRRKPTHLLVSFGAESHLLVVPPFDIEEYSDKTKLFLDEWESNNDGDLGLDNRACQVILSASLSRRITRAVQVYLTSRGGGGGEEEAPTTTPTTTTTTTTTTTPTTRMASSPSVRHTPGLSYRLFLDRLSRRTADALANGIDISATPNLDVFRAVWLVVLTTIILRRFVAKNELLTVAATLQPLRGIRELQPLDELPIVPLHPALVITDVILVACCLVAGVWYAIELNISLPPPPNNAAYIMVAVYAAMGGMATTFVTAISIRNVYRGSAASCVADGVVRIFGFCQRRRRPPPPPQRRQVKEGDGGQSFHDGDSVGVDADVLEGRTWMIVALVQRLCGYLVGLTALIYSMWWDVNDLYNWGFLVAIFVILYALLFDHFMTSLHIAALWRSPPTAFYAAVIGLLSAIAFFTSYTDIWQPFFVELAAGSYTAGQVKWMIAMAGVFLTATIVYLKPYQIQRTRLVYYNHIYYVKIERPNRKHPNTLASRSNNNYRHSFPTPTTLGVFGAALDTSSSAFL